MLHNEEVQEMLTSLGENYDVARDCLLIVYHHSVA